MWAAARECSTTRPPCARRWGPAAAAAATACWCWLPQAACLPARSATTLSICFPLQPGYEVVLIGYCGAALVDELQGPATDGRLTVRYLPEL